MIPLSLFLKALFIVRRLDDEQRDIVGQPADAALFIGAGPGTGKTTVLWARILKMVLVDGLPPAGILATTFTVKAAAELRSRVLGYGLRLVGLLQQDPDLTQEQQDWLASVDINQVRTGTIDSLCEQLLREFRAPGTQPPILADDFVSRTLMLREGLFKDQRFRDPDLDGLLFGLYQNRYGFNTGTKTELLQQLWDRRWHDQVNWQDFVTSAPPMQATGRTVAAATLEDYRAALNAKQMVDFALLEQEVLNRLAAGTLAEFTDTLKVVLVDEYQDSNLLQERLYFALAGACHGALTVVGDDDQSLYRFRGATVDLFRNFPARYEQRFGVPPLSRFLANNYRSTQRIVLFVREYATLDAGYQDVRVEKPALQWGPKAAAGSPILAMFRPTIDELARDLADFIHAVFRGDGVTFPDGTLLIRDPEAGDVGDTALLCSSPAEFAANGRVRLPRLLRDELAEREPPIEVFNPRGQDFAGLTLVQRLGGLLLECLDPGGVVEIQATGLSPDARRQFATWRAEATRFVEDAATDPDLLPYAMGWVDRDPQQPGFQWPRSVSVLELVYGLVHYFPEFYNDPEGQVYLEVFTRQLAACEQIGSFKGRVVTDPANTGLADASVRELLVDFLAPIATGAVKVDEELMEAFPRDRLSLLSIHQAKGLEFPLTIVDVGSDFRDGRSPAFKRFPVDGSPAHRAEDLVRPYSPLGPSPRSQVDRAFDDLFRQFFVAFSRPQEVLLLVGVRPTFPGRKVQNVATGWDRTGVCRWADDLPFEEI